MHERTQTLHNIVRPKGIVNELALKFPLGASPLHLHQLGNTNTSNTNVVICVASHNIVSLALSAPRRQSINRQSSLQCRQDAQP